MEFAADILHYLISFIVVLSVIVFIHEFGHYIVAKWCKVRIEVFSIGFGKEIFGWNDKSGTRWKVSLLPLGGYVKMFGDASEASTPDDDALDKMSSEDKKVAFHFKSLPQKAAIVVAGPLANFVLTIAIFTWFVLQGGITSTEPVVGSVMPGTAAEEAGLQAGDRFLTINGEPVEVFNDISYLIATNLGTPVEVSLKRGDEIVNLTIAPRMTEAEDAFGNRIKRPLIGIKSTELTFEDVGLSGALWEATKRTYLICETTLRVVGQMIAGERSASDLKGPVGIAKLSGQATQTMDMNKILWFIAMLSANLGLVNLFPIPLLDGGHLLFYAVEGVRGRPMAQKIQDISFRIGFALLGLLMAFTLLNDIRNLL